MKEFEIEQKQWMGRGLPMMTYPFSSNCLHTLENNLMKRLEALEASNTQLKGVIAGKDAMIAVSYKSQKYIFINLLLKGTSGFIFTSIGFKAG